MTTKNDMQLPEGKTCADCANWSVCDFLISCIENNTECDFSPSRFVEIGKPEDNTCPDCDGSGEVACEGWYNADGMTTCGRYEGKGTI
jgi:DnaJ-class molecular chaperone